MKRAVVSSYHRINYYHPRLTRGQAYRPLGLVCFVLRACCLPVYVQFRLSTIPSSESGQVLLCFLVGVCKLTCIMALF